MALAQREQFIRRWVSRRKAEAVKHAARPLALRPRAASLYNLTPAHINFLRRLSLAWNSRASAREREEWQDEAGLFFHLLNIPQPCRSTSIFSLPSPPPPILPPNLGLRFSWGINIMMMLCSLRRQLVVKSGGISVPLSLLNLAVYLFGFFPSFFSFHFFFFKRADV